MEIEKEKLLDQLTCIIDDWYIYWKSGITNYETKTHRLGYAKEQLKKAVYDLLTEKQGE